MRRQQAVSIANYVFGWNSARTDLLWGLELVWPSDFGGYRLCTLTFTGLGAAHVALACTLRPNQPVRLPC